MEYSKQEERYVLKRGLKYTLSFVLIIWLVKLIEFNWSLDFGDFGILPRTLQGSLGIFLAPFIHGDFFHLISNTFPILLLGVGLFYFYDKIAINVVLTIYLITGFWVWLAARDAFHIGASGLVYGLLSFLLFSGFLRKDKSALAMSFIILLLYGSTLFYGIFPSVDGVSWESHLMGALAGLFCAIYFRNVNVSLSNDIDKNVISIDVPFRYIYKENEAISKTYTYTYKSIDKSTPTHLDSTDAKASVD